MSKAILIRNCKLVNEGEVKESDVLLADGVIQFIGKYTKGAVEQEIDGSGKLLFPGVIDGQVHFREPGLVHKGDLYSESRAAVAGGVTSFIDMPNTVPNVLTPELLEEKYQLASLKSMANYGFMLGVNAGNLDLVLGLDLQGHLGVTDDGLYFSGKGNLLADNPQILEKLFSGCRSLIAIHSEKESLIEPNEERYREEYGEDIPVRFHPLIRTSEACYTATAEAIALAEKHKARLHILHVSTEAETALFRNDLPLAEKKITAEVSVHHLWFCDTDYERLGTLIKWNPAIKTDSDRRGLLKALCEDRLDIVTTDHAPHLLQEKEGTYFKSFSGAPIVQHSLVIMLEFYRRGLISLAKIAEKMCHNPALIYGIEKRGFIREGYHADLVLVDPDSRWTVSKNNLLYKCGWSPLEGQEFAARVSHTFVNGNLVFEEGRIHEGFPAMPLRRKVEKSSHV